MRDSVTADGGADAAITPATADTVGHSSLLARKRVLPGAALKQTGEALKLATGHIAQEGLVEWMDDAVDGYRRVSFGQVARAPSAGLGASR